MPIVAVEDVQNELPTLRISDTSQPGIDQVATYITEIESEVRARLEAAPAVWPADGTAAAAYLRQTIIEGVRWKTLRAKYAMSRSNDHSSDISESYKAYMDRLNQVPLIARSVQNVLDTQAGQSAAGNVPKVADGTWGPVASASFDQYTQARDAVDRYWTGQRWTGVRPWPLL